MRQFIQAFIDSLIVFLYAIVILSFIMVPITEARSLLSLSENGIYTFSVLEAYYSVLTTDDGDQQEIDFLRVTKHFIRIDKLDMNEGNITYTKWNSYGDEERTEHKINAEGLEETYIFFPYFVDYELRGIVFDWHYFFDKPRYFVVPDWEGINNILKQTSFNGAAGSPYGSGTIEMFLNMCKSYTLMEKSNLEQARAMLNKDTRRWTGHFIVDDAMYYGRWDTTLLENIYLPYDKFEWMFVVEYSDTGILNLVNVTEKLTREGLEYRETYLLKSGLLEAPSNRSNNFVFGTLFLLGLIIMLVIIIRYQKQ